jgi:ATP-dependent Clp protease protease subunit
MTNKIESYADLPLSSLELGNVYVFGEITTKTSLQFCLKVDYLANLGLKEMYVWINTEGGSVADALVIQDKIQLLKKNNIQVNTVAIGECISAGCFILATGSRRYAMSSATIMAHPIMHSLSPDYHIYIKNYVHFHDKFYNELMTELAMKCGRKNAKDIQNFLKDVSNSHWMNAEEALEFGLIDEIL